jgi:hypothetical protein
MTTEPEKEIEGARKVALCHRMINLLKDEGLAPFETVGVLLAAAASVALVGSTSERADFEKLAGDVFTHFAKSNDDIRGMR